MWCFRTKKNHVCSLQPGCQVMKEADVSCLGNEKSFDRSLSTTYLGRWSYEAPKPKWQQVLPKSSRWGRPGRYDGCWRVSCSSSLQHPSSHLHLQDKNWFQQGKCKLWQKILAVVKAGGGLSTLIKHRPESPGEIQVPIVRRVTIKILSLGSLCLSEF